MGFEALTVPSGRTVVLTGSFQGFLPDTRILDRGFTLSGG
jgi:hypothetical protein